MNTELQRILENLSPALSETKYVFCTLKGGKYGDMPQLKPIASYMEEEGLTLVLEESRARTASLPFEGTFCCITLRVKSSLMAVGLTAAISQALAEHGISANIIAAYHHDHIFVPSEDRKPALHTLRTLSERTSHNKG